MSEQRKIPVMELTPEQIEQLNGAFRRIGEQARAAAQAIGRAYGQGLPDIREKLAKIDTSDFTLRT